jgi:hypothetical protein
MKSRLLLDVVVTESTTILELLASKDQTLLVGGNAEPKIKTTIYPDEVILAHPSLS